VISDTSERLGEVLSSAFHVAKARVPTLYPIGLEDDRWELHISLSRPTFLWTHQREEFKNAVCRVAASHRGWALSLAKFIKLENDDRSRVFLAIQVGAGHEQVRLSISFIFVCAQE
jgi:U6 snRNA phosphodiesterase